VDAGDLVAGKYRLQRLLGAGSMGSVWAARNELTNRDFAIKFLRAELAQNEEALSRFFHEARACGQIRHPAIVDVFDVGHAEDGSPFLVMELLEGEGLDVRIARQGRLRPVEVCRWIAIVAQGLDEAHVRGLVHRDLKPGNIFFAIDKRSEVFPKVLDFGIAKEVYTDGAELVQTNQGTVLGSPAYMSPEQARGDLVIDARSDVWSLGVIMYEALTGQLPFHANNYNALMMAIITEAHQPVQQVAPEVPVAMAMLVDDLLAKDRDKRVKSAAHLADRLQRIHATLTQTPFDAPDLSLSSSLSISRIHPLATQRSWSGDGGESGGRRWATPALVAIVLLVMAGAGYGWYRSATVAEVPAAGQFSPNLSAWVDRMAVRFDRAVAANAPKEEPQEPQLYLDLDDLPSGARETRLPRGRGSKPTDPSEPAAPPSKPTVAEPTDPHGGVDSAGF
jgi:serine/threonine-protein kinase